MGKTIGTLTIILLLVMLIAVQLLTWLVPPPSSAECRQAREAASVDLEGIYSEYRRMAYDRADNIYQQQFAAAEFAFVMLQVVAKQNAALLACGR